MPDQTPPEQPSSQAEPPTPLSRRELLKKAGWVVPAIIAVPLMPQEAEATWWKDDKKWKDYKKWKKPKHHVSPMERDKKDKKYGSHSKIDLDDILDEWKDKWKDDHRKDPWKDWKDEWKDDWKDDKKGSEWLEDIFGWLGKGRR